MKNPKIIPQKIILFISVIAFITAIVFILLFSENRATVIKGEIDFTNSDLFNERIYKLNGEWKLVPDQFMPPDTDPDKVRDSLFQKVPGNWNRLHDPEGFATYLLKIRVPQEDGPLVLLMPSVSTAYKLFINGLLVAGNGTVGKSGEESRPQFRYNLIEIGEHKGFLNLVIHTSNYHYSKGGIWISPSIGRASKVRNQFQTMFFITTFVSGGFFLVGLSLMFLFLFRRKFKTYENLGFLCLLMALRTLLVGEIPITQFFPDFPWALQIRLEYITMALGFLSFNSYIYHLYKKYYKRPIYYIFTTLSIVFAVTISVMPVIFFTSLVNPIQILIVSGFLHFYYLFYLSRGEMKQENTILLFGFTVIQAMVILDILLANNLIHFNLFQSNTTVGLLIFIFCNAVILMKLAVRTSANLEQLTKGLEKSVEARTKELELINRELFDMAITDKLTGINNRHEYTRILKYEDARYKRSGSNYAALYLDLDNFKYINDTYGHPAGDLILKLFVSILKACSRDSDYLFRMGGDEFYILMTESNSSADAGKLAERILKDLNKAKYFLEDLKEFTGKNIKYPQGKEFSVTIGISSTEIGKSESLNDLLIQSDIALLQAKAAGKNRFAFFE